MKKFIGFLLCFFVWELGSAYGQELPPLRVKGTTIVNDLDQPIQLKGMSTMGLQWTQRFIHYQTIQWLKDDWKTNVLRAAMYTKEGGYIDNPSIKDTLKNAVNGAIYAGMYVIVDWHNLSDGNPQTYKNQAKAFFDEISKEYGAYPNVIYELCNEPNGNGVNWDNVVKPYNEELIQVIRQNDPDNIIIACTPNWATNISAVARNPIRNQTNLMYNVHFYSGGTDGNWLRGEVDKALNVGIPVFVTEWGTSYYTGNDGLYFDSARQWLKFMKDRNIGWANWSLSDKNETSAALKPGASGTGHWPESDLSESGKFIRKYLREGSALTN